VSSTHSIMFHHFHGFKHLPAPGSLSGDEFEAMLDWLGKKHNLIGASEYLHKLNINELEPSEVCLSFDDALLSQYDIALPILNERRLNAFFFVYSSVFTEKPDYLEIFRHFRTNCFSSVDDFYEIFFGIVKLNFSDELSLHKKEYKKLDYLSICPFYTENDKWFRYLRDKMLGVTRYEKLMLDLMEARSFDSAEVIKDLWMSEDNLKDIATKGHLIGLHSYSHPTQMSELNYDDQMNQYVKNLEHLEGLIGKNKVVSMSHPCGDYNDDTLRILSDLNIQIGFRSNLSRADIKSKFEVPRDDHANVFKAMKQ